jgi:hypothetical protein
VRELVRVTLGIRLLLVQRLLAGLGEDERLPVRDEPGVLHRAGVEHRDRDHVDLLERYGDPEVILELIDDRARRLGGHAASPRPAFRDDDADRTPLRVLPASTNSKGPTANATR